jgi:hypothetical protein
MNGVFINYLEYNVPTMGYINRRCVNVIGETVALDINLAYDMDGFNAILLSEPCVRARSVVKE